MSNEHYMKTYQLPKGIWLDEQAAVQVGRTMRQAANFIRACDEFDDKRNPLPGWLEGFAASIDPDNKQKW